MADVASSLSGAGKLSKKSKSTAKGLAGEGDVQTRTSSAITSHSTVSVGEKLLKTDASWRHENHQSTTNWKWSSTGEDSLSPCHLQTVLSDARD